MDAFGFADLLDEGPARHVLARLTVHSRERGGPDLPGGIPYRPNHNFGAEENRSFYIGQIELPSEGLRAGESGVVRVTFLSGPVLGELLRVGRQWRVQEGSRCVATAEVLEVKP